MFEAAWKEGLRFTCRQCSGCCSGSPGLVRLGEADILILTIGLGMNLESFAATYCRSVDTGGEPCLCLKEKPGYDCIFLDAGVCSVYEFRPTQCRTYPFWDEVVETENAWAREAKTCPGIGSGHLNKPEQIAESLQKQRKLRSFRWDGKAPGKEPI
ncbi:MAG: YkgJ family cysteine cluster protein [Spirochaetes bacterium]|nr:YkgJ family cysteine cluster protein [Spirochaetota bacterium]